MLPRHVDKGFADKLEASYGEEGKKIASGLQEGVKVICLNGHPAFTSAYCNDVEADMVFAQQVYVLGREGDIFAAFTTSGNSANIVKALKVAKAKGMGTLVFTGKCGGKSGKLADCAVKVPEDHTYRIQEHHLPIYHALCASLEEEFYGKGS